MQIITMTKTPKAIARDTDLTVITQNKKTVSVLLHPTQSCFPWQWDG